MKGKESQVLDKDAFGEGHLEDEDDVEVFTCEERVVRLEGSFIGEVFSLGVGLDMFFCLELGDRCKLRGEMICWCMGMKPCCCCLGLSSGNVWRKEEG